MNAEDVPVGSKPLVERAELLVLGSGAKNILAAAGRGEPDLLHFAYLQARLQAP